MENAKEEVTEIEETATVEEAPQEEQPAEAGKEIGKKIRLVNLAEF